MRATPQATALLRLADVPGRRLGVKFSKVAKSADLLVTELHELGVSVVATDSLVPRPVRMLTSASPRRKAAVAITIPSMTCSIARSSLVGEAERPLCRAAGCTRAGPHALIKAWLLEVGR
jgi:hypothetical protein